MKCGGVECFIPGQNEFGHGAASPYGSLSTLSSRVSVQWEDKIELTIMLYLLVVLDSLSQIAESAKDILASNHRCGFALASRYL